jgi:hypothetical protein
MTKRKANVGNYIKLKNRKWYFTKKGNYNPINKGNILKIVNSRYEEFNNRFIYDCLILDKRFQARVGLRLYSFEFDLINDSNALSKYFKKREVIDAL